MADFEHFEREAARIVAEIERKLAMLQLDWRDPETMRQLAGSVLSPEVFRRFIDLQPGSPSNRSWQELKGLIGLMLRTMEEGAQAGLQVHGNEAWKALARALWSEYDKEGKFPPIVPRET